MKAIIHYVSAFLGLSILCITCNGQVPSGTQTSQTLLHKSELIGGGCDGCELMFVGMPAQISPADTSRGWQGPNQKLLVTGTVYQLNGRTPARNVLLYYWHTDATGRYTPTDGMNPRAKRHGALRGWVKTDTTGRYAIYTSRPAPYPGGSEPEHIHVSVKEPDLPNEYYIDDVIFDDDPLVIEASKKRPFVNRGGSGLVRIVLSDAVQIAERDIILGLNINNYPQREKTGIQSGLHIGEDSPSFVPVHAWGPDKGSTACPVCRYGRYHGILYFVGNHPGWPEIRQWLTFLEQESATRGQYLKAYFIYGNAVDYDPETSRATLVRIGQELGLKRIALTVVPSLTDTKTDVHLNKINPAVTNTFVIYQHRKIVDKFIELPPTAGSFDAIRSALNRTESHFFNLPTPKHE
ncbi:MAG: intradiol ring-cleavage dioxygenase [Spirosoma sp.]|nr:intradiol ring-cleavage dioxygenase [Spirosoma sp.]